MGAHVEKTYVDEEGAREKGADWALSVQSIGLN